MARGILQPLRIVRDTLESYASIALTVVDDLEAEMRGTLLFVDAPAIAFLEADDIELVA